MNIETYLNKHKEALVNELTYFFKKDLPEEVRCIEVMLFREALPSIPFRILFLNRFQATAKNIDSFVPLSGLKKLIDSSKYITREDAICDCLELEKETDQNLCMDSVNEEYNNENERLCRWFAECWNSAGGSDYLINAFVVEEDGQFNPLNLKTGKYIKHIHEYNKVFDG